MATIERARPRVHAGWTQKQLRKEMGSLKPGDVFSIDRPITIEEFCEYVSEEWAAELDDGVVYIMSPPSDAHEALSAWLLTLLHLFVEIRRLGEVRGGKSGVRITNTSLREPDLLFFSIGRLDRMTARGVHGAPDLAVEIVDSDSARRDAVRKQVRYEEIGIREYWVIDLPFLEVRQLILDEGGYHVERLKPGDQLVARTVEGFHLNVAWFSRALTFPRAWKY